MNSGNEQLLRQHGLQVTAQRIATLGAVAAHPHATADELTEYVRITIGAVSRQAVYDTLSVLVDKNLVRRIQTPGSPARYEDRVGDNHHHLICRGCGMVSDIDCAVGKAPCLTAKDAHGFDIDEAEVIYWGRCPTCRPAAATATKAAPRAKSTATAKKVARITRAPRTDPRT
jgi:Fur family ferric uptake transcriptional regulator